MILIPMLKYVLSHSKPDYVEEDGFQNGYTEIYKYAEFLNKKAEIGFFIPCDKLGSILEKHDLSDDNGRQYNKNIDEDLAWSEYKNAKDRILFEGFYFFNNNGVFWLKSDNTEIKIFWDTEDRKWYFVEKDYTIENLIHHNLKLTKKGLNVLFGKAII